MTNEMDKGHWTKLIARVYEIEEAKKKKMDKVDQDELKGDHDDRDDKDIDNDGDVDSSDEYLHNRRKKTSKAIKSKGKGAETEVQVDEAAPTAKQRALANVKAQPKDKVTLPKAPWEKAAAKKEGYRVHAVSKDNEKFKSGLHATKKAATDAHYKMSKSGMYKNIELVKESGEQIDELSNKTLGSYIGRAALYTAGDVKKDPVYKRKKAFRKNFKPKDGESTGNPTIDKMRSDYKSDMKQMKNKNVNRQIGIQRAARRIANEDTQWPVYARIMERAEHYKSATDPQAADDNYSQGAKDFVAQHDPNRQPEDYVDINKVVDMNKEDMVKNLPGKSANRPNDQKVGQPSPDTSNGKDKM